MQTEIDIHWDFLTTKIKSTNGELEEEQLFFFFFLFFPSVHSGNGFFSSSDQTKTLDIVGSVVVDKS